MKENYYNTEDLAYDIAQELGLERYEYENLIRDINSGRAPEWIEFYEDDEEAVDAMNALKKYCHLVFDEDDCAWVVDYGNKE
jgi:hypothetical protein